MYLLLITKSRVPRPFWEDYLHGTDSLVDKTTIVLKQMLGWEGEYSILHSCRLSSNRAAILG